jgi:hypothetical protein
LLQVWNECAQSAKKIEEVPGAGVELPKEFKDWFDTTSLAADGPTVRLMLMAWEASNGREPTQHEIENGLRPDPKPQCTAELTGDKYVIRDKYTGTWLAEFMGETATRGWIEDNGYELFCPSEFPLSFLNPLGIADLGRATSATGLRSKMPRRSTAGRAATGKSAAFAVVAFRGSMTGGVRCW